MILNSKYFYLVFILNVFLVSCFSEQKGKTKSKRGTIRLNKEKKKTPIMKMVEKIVEGDKKKEEIIPENRKTLSLGVKDSGIFSQYDSKVKIELPAWVKNQNNSIIINKKKRILVLYHNNIPVKVYPVALGSNPSGRKLKVGDKKTPEGKYYICEKKMDKGKFKGIMKISYPNLEDAKRGLKSHLISKSDYKLIKKGIKQKILPYQFTKLGSSIRIHGGGVAKDWTKGCIAMRDEDSIELYSHVSLKTPVIITADKTPYDADGDGIPNQLDILLGAIKLTYNKAKYDGSYQSLKYPGGDVSNTIGVCSDVVIRAMRNAGIDLQKLVHKDILTGSYPWIKKPDTNIDHRRVKSLIKFFKRHYKLLDKGINSRNKNYYMPGDVIFMDTLPKPGPDHMGIVSGIKGDSGYPLIINNWTTGYKTGYMDLLPSVKVTHHFRIK